MKTLIVFAISAICLAAADGPGRTVRPIEIPKKAVEVEAGTYRFTDAAGHKWIYRKTPFGVARIPDQPAPEPMQSMEGVRAVDAGDSVRFERPGPFGVYRWETRKSELNGGERAVWNQARQK